MSKIDIKYHNLLQKILDEGYDYLDESRQVNCKQISSYEFRHNLRTEGFPAISTKKLYWKGVVGELIWFLRGDSHIKYLLDNNINIWNKDGYNFYLKMYEQYPLGKEKLSFDQWIDKQRSKRTEFSGDLGRIYGQQWRKWSDIRKAEDQAYLLGINSYESDVNPEDFIPDTTDQFKDLIQNLKDKPMSRRHLITAWNPAELDQMALPPCHWAFEIIPRPLTLKERGDIYNKKGNFLFTGSWGMSEKDIVQEYIKEYDSNNIPKYTFDLKWHQRSVDTFLG